MAINSLLVPILIVFLSAYDGSRVSELPSFLGSMFNDGPQVNSGCAASTYRFTNNSSSQDQINIYEPRELILLDNQIAVDNLIAPSGGYSGAQNEDEFGSQDITSRGLMGTWHSNTAQTELTMLIFFEDGTYYHGEVNKTDTAEASGMELGTYSQNTDTGLLTVTQIVDKNGDAGLTNFVGPGAPNIFVDVQGDTLTAGIDEDGDAVIDKTIVFLRQ
jgi:hypothetical protein